MPRPRIAALALALALLGAASAPAPPDAAPGTSQLATGRFLVAAEHVRGPYFQQSVVFLVSHGESGTLGLIVNQPSELALHDVVQGAVDGAGQMYIGGPVGRASVMVLLRAKAPPERALRVTGDIFVTVDPAILLEHTGKPGGANEVRVYAGYAGWGPGQLEAELARGDWIVADETAVEAVVFADAPDELWKKLHLRHHRLRALAPATPGWRS